MKVALNVLHQNILYVINATAYHLGRYEPSTDKLHYQTIKTAVATFGQLLQKLGNFVNIGATFRKLRQLFIPTFLGNFCKGVKTYHFSSEIIFGQLL